MSTTSVRGDFKITASSKFATNETIFAGRNYVPEDYRVGFTIANNTSVTINTCSVSFNWYYRTSTGDADLITSGSQIFSSESASWSGEKTFTGIVKLDRSVKDQMYSGPTSNGTLQISPDKNYGICITIRYKRAVRNQNGVLVTTQVVDYIRFSQEETDKYMPVWIKPFKPYIEVNAVRFDPKLKIVSDEGTKILVAVKLNTSGNFTAQQMIDAGYPSKLSIALATSASSSPSGTTEVTLDECMSGVYEFMIVGGKATATVTAPEVYTEDVSLARDWVLTVGFNDYYEPARNGVLIRGPFANVHLSEFKNGDVYGLTEGGVCFGGFSKAPDFGYAAFESYYPTFLYGGIEQIGKKNADGSLWNELSPASSNITTPGTYGDFLQIRRIENKCIIKGSVMMKPGSGTTTIAVLPEDYKPMRCTYRLNGCQGARIARVAVHGTEGTNYGELVLEWVYSIGGSQFTESAIWIDCAIEYWIDGGES